MTQRVAVVQLRSAGPDGEEDTDDDFDVCELRHPLQERASAEEAWFIGPADSDSTGSIDGSVRDESEAGLPGVTVTASRPGIELEHTTTSDDDGLYVFDGLPAGLYEVRLERAGFHRVLVTEVPLQPNGETWLGVNLIAINDVPQAETVTGESLDFFAPPESRPLDSSPPPESPASTATPTPRLREDFPETLVRRGSSLPNSGRFRYSTGS